MIWADRAGIVWAGTVLFLYFAMCKGLGALTGGSPLDPVFWLGWWRILLVFALPPWLLLRGLAWVGGSHHRV